MMRMLEVIRLMRMLAGTTSGTRRKGSGGSSTPARIGGGITLGNGQGAAVAQRGRRRTGRTGMNGSNGRMTQASSSSRGEAAVAAGSILITYRARRKNSNHRRPRLMTDSLILDIIISADACYCP
mmetsp:Transcript_6604/g.7754  ORF Transcript_6604/g.7754 Transcript_6604/m.7754 type:complete len:125 (+) Transcript_6604:132-506(+)